MLLDPFIRPDNDNNSEKAPFNTSAIIVDIIIVSELSSLHLWSYFHSTAGGPGGCFE